MKFEDIELTVSEHTFELVVDSHRAFIEYLHKNDKYYLVHTEVPQQLEGRGVGGALVEKTFKYLEEHGAKAVPMCAFIQSYIKRHPELSKVVA